MNKSISILVGILALVCGFTSCDMLSRVDVTDQSSVDKRLPSLFEGKVDPEASVFNISLLTTSDFSVDMDIITIQFINPGEENMRQLNFTVPGNQEPREVKVLSSESRTKTVTDGMKLKDIDFSKIASNVNKAAEILQQENIALDGVKGYNITLDSDPEKIIHTFNALSKSNTEFGSKNGRAALVTEYYEFRFEADANGNVTQLD